MLHQRTQNQPAGRPAQNPKHKTRNLVLLFILIVLFSSCNAWHYGYTYSKAENSYSLVTGNKKNFGDRRIKYSKGFFHNSEYARFLNWKGNPDFIYEYETTAKCRGIKLFYNQLDSAFVFEEPKKHNMRPVLKEYRKIDPYEHQTYERLKNNE